MVAERRDDRQHLFIRDEPTSVDKLVLVDRVAHLAQRLAQPHLLAALDAELRHRQHQGAHAQGGAYAYPLQGQSQQSQQSQLRQ